jgi:hypothetical protein
MEFFVRVFKTRQDSWAVGYLLALRLRESRRIYTNSKSLKKTDCQNWQSFYPKISLFLLKTSNMQNLRFFIDFLKEVNF